MATRRQPLIPGWLIPGVSATTLVVAVALAAFLALWWNAPQDDWVAVWQDSYLWHVVRFSFWQAFLSALLSVVPAIFLARALYRRRFPGRLALLRLCAMTLILPVLVAVFGILSVNGHICVRIAFLISSFIPKSLSAFSAAILGCLYACHLCHFLP